jgi:NDP-sugar pyrophosphorylase family protein
MAGILSDIPTSVTITDPVFIDPGVQVGEGAKLGPNVYIEAGSIIGERTELKNSIVLGVRVGRDRTITDTVIHQERL